MKHDPDRNNRMIFGMWIGAGCLTIIIELACTVGVVALCAFVVGKIFGWC